jgi:hypothetical protein
MNLTENIQYNETSYIERSKIYLVVCVATSLRPAKAKIYRV